MNIFSIFKRAAQNLPLTPGERTFLKLFKGWFITAIGAGVVTGTQLLTSGTAEYQRIILVAGGAALLSLLMALEKWFTAQGDTAFALAAQVGEQKVQQAVQQATQPQVQVAPAQPSQSSQNPNLIAQGTAVPQVPFQSTGRHFGDSVVMPAVQPQQPGQVQ